MRSIFLKIRAERVKVVKKSISLLLLLALLLGLCACGGEQGPYRVLETIGQKHYGLVFRQGDKLAAPVNAAMSVLAANGTLSQLSTGWLGSDIISLEGDAEALMQLQMAQAIEPRILIVGVEEDFRPLSFSEGEGYIGMSADIAGKIGELLGWEIRLQPISGSEIGPQLASGNIDCALGFGVEKIDTAKYDVGSCYMTTDISVAVRGDSEIKKLKDINQQRVGTIQDESVIAAAQADEKLARYASGATRYLTAARCMNALDNGWCAAVVMDSIMLKEYFR